MEIIKSGIKPQVVEKYPLKVKSGLEEIEVLEASYTITDSVFHFDVNILRRDIYEQVKEDITFKEDYKAFLNRMLSKAVEYGIPSIT